MTLRKLAWAVLTVVLVVAAVGMGWALLGTHTVTLTQQQLQDKVNPKMPYTHAKSGVTVQSVTIDLSAEKVGAAFDASTTKLRTDLTVKAHTQGSLKYDSERGAFYYHPDSLTLNGASVNGHVATPGVLRATQNGVDALVLEAAQAALDRIPVYTLKDDVKGTIVRLVVDSVEVKDGTVIAHLSFWRLTGWVIGYAVLFLICILVAIGLALNPEAFAAVEIFTLFG